MPRPLLVTADPNILDDLLRLAATAGVEVEVAYDLPAVRRSWNGAPLVVLGPDLLDRCAAGRQVVVLGQDLDDPTIGQRVVQVGAEHVVFLPDGERWLVDALADAVEGTGIDGLLVAVIGGRGAARRPHPSRWPSPRCDEACGP